MILRSSTSIASLSPASIAFKYPSAFIADDIIPDLDVLVIFLLYNVLCVAVEGERTLKSRLLPTSLRYSGEINVRDKAVSEVLSDARRSVCVRGSMIRETR